MSKPTLLIDGDIVAYKAAAAVERETKWDEDLWTLHGFEGDAIKSMEEQVASIKKRLDGGDIVFALSDGRSFRYDLLPTYKHNRRDVRKPLLLGAMKQHLLDQHKTFLRPRLEGDDILGILMTSKTIITGLKIQVSIDKDQKCIPGLLYNQKTDKLVEITPVEADRYHMLQTLAGDATDGYGGCPGIGVDRAAEALEAMTVLVPYEHTFKSGPRKGLLETRYTEEPTESLWDLVVSRYKAAGFGEEYALVQARVARILRNTDYNFDLKEFIPWNPPRPTSAPRA
jgi:DNA polymerase-1